VHFLVPRIVFVLLEEVLPESQLPNANMSRILEKTMVVMKNKEWALSGLKVHKNHPPLWKSCSSIMSFK